MSLALDKSKQMKIGTVALAVLFCVLFLFSLEATAERRIALVIGNGAYGADPLSDPPNDAQLIADTLKRLEFEVIRHIDLNQQDMKKVIREFGKRIKNQKDSVGVFYYSGHGMQVRGRNYMIPVGVSIESEADVEINGVGVDEVLTRMHYAGNVMNFLFLDACRNNPFEKSFKSTDKGLGRMDAPKGTIIAFAAQPNKVASQGPGDYSYFTEALAREIVKRGISARDILLDVRKAVHRKTLGKQLPVVEDQALDKYYFNPEGSLPVVDEPSIETPSGVMGPQPFTGKWKGIDPHDNSTIKLTLEQKGTELKGYFRDSHSRNVAPGFEGHGSGTASSTNARIAFDLARHDGLHARLELGLRHSDPKDALTVIDTVFNGKSIEFTMELYRITGPQDEIPSRLSIPLAKITIDGSIDDWRSVGPVCVDSKNEHRPANFPGTDLHQFYLAKDAKYLYMMIKVHNGPPKIDQQTLYFFLARQNLDDDNSGDRDAAAIFHFGNRSSRVSIRRADGTPFKSFGPYPSSYVGVGQSAVEWKVPLRDMGDLDGKYATAYIHVVGPVFNPVSDECTTNTQLSGF